MSEKFDLHNPAEVLLVEDDPGDIELTQETLNQSKLIIKLNIVNDGVQALKYLRNEKPYQNVERPDLILLDLNLPKMDGKEVLKEIRSDNKLRAIPVVILTTSEAEEDVLKTYSLGANCFVTKPLGLEQFSKVVRSIEDFWFTVVKLPTSANE